MIIARELSGPPCEYPSPSLALESQQFVIIVLALVAILSIVAADLRSGRPSIKQMVQHPSHLVARAGPNFPIVISPESDPIHGPFSDTYH